MHFDFLKHFGLFYVPAVFGTMHLEGASSWGDVLY